MKYATLYNGNTIPVLGQGTWGLGGGMTPDHSQDENTLRVIRAAIELALTPKDAGPRLLDLESKVGFPQKSILENAERSLHTLEVLVDHPRQ